MAAVTPRLHINDIHKELRKICHPHYSPWQLPSAEIHEDFMSGKWILCFHPTSFSFGTIFSSFLFVFPGFRRVSLKYRRVEGSGRRKSIYPDRLSIQLSGTCLLRWLRMIMTRRQHQSPVLVHISMQRIISFTRSLLKMFQSPFYEIVQDF